MQTETKPTRLLLILLMTALALAAGTASRQDAKVAKTQGRIRTTFAALLPEMLFLLLRVISFRVMRVSTQKRNVASLKTSFASGSLVSKF